MLMEKVKKALQNITIGSFNENTERYEIDIYADYRDEIDDKSVAEILSSEEPFVAFNEKLFDWYEDSFSYYENELFEAVVSELEIENEDEEEIRSILYEITSFQLPSEHFLKQELYVDIFVDTGDGNYDYTLNSVYPCYYGRKGEIHDDKAAIVWLAKQQGYGKKAFRKAMEEGDLADPKGFLQSMRQELANLPSSMSSLTFLVKMTFEELFKLNHLIKLQERNGHNYDKTKNPDCGYIILDKSTETGLYDLWNGGGSVFEIELEKDVKLPIKFIRSALPDGCDGNWSISEVYGMSGSCWRDTIKNIAIPKF